MLSSDWAAVHFRTVQTIDCQIAGKQSQHWRNKETRKRWNKQGWSHLAMFNHCNSPFHYPSEHGNLEQRLMRLRTKLCFLYRLSHTYLLLFSKKIMESGSSWGSTCKQTTQCCRRTSYTPLGVTSEQASAQLKTNEDQFQKARLLTPWSIDHRRSLCAVRAQISSEKCCGQSYKSWRYTACPYQHAKSPWPKVHIHVVSGITVLSKTRKLGTTWKTGHLSCKAGMSQK